MTDGEVSGQTGERVRKADEREEEGKRFDNEGRREEEVVRRDSGKGGREGTRRRSEAL